jgi:hypothetical protein
MREPAQFARQSEESPALADGACDRVSGYAVMGLTFRSGHVLGLRRWTTSSAGEAFTSIWHRDPDGRWTFYESARSEIACTRYFGADVARARVESIRLDWEGPRRLCQSITGTPSSPYPRPGAPPGSGQVSGR